MVIISDVIYSQSLRGSTKRVGQLRGCSTAVSRQVTLQHTAARSRLEILIPLQKGRRVKEDRGRGLNNVSDHYHLRCVLELANGSKTLQHSSKEGKKGVSYRHLP